MAVIKVSCIKGVHDVKEGETVDIALIDFADDDEHSVDELEPPEDIESEYR